MASTKLILSRLVRDQSYPMRRAALVEAIEQLNNTRWDGGTSAWFLFHQSTPSELLDTLLINGGIYRDQRDMLVILDLKTLQFAHIGVDDPGVLEFVLKVGNAPIMRAAGR
jgi:hypothetical protein